LDRTRTAVGSAIFFVVAPGVVAGFVPWWLTGWRFAPFWMPLRILGAVLTIAGGLVLVSAFARFVMEGIGTPAPVAPTQHLVVGGLYRYVRNPMYIAVVTAIVGQALLFGQLGLLVYAAVMGAAMWAFATFYEGPYLAERFGDEYEQYRRDVPGWWPRLRQKSRQ
jgi:protein-S-isoprenylcysteine O-methyltransferase Ste14